MKIVYKIEKATAAKKYKCLVSGDIIKKDEIHYRVSVKNSGVLRVKERYDYDEIEEAIEDHVNLKNEEYLNIIY
jgi:hypothetical protein